MSWSLYEVESLARKAARGTGLPWGIAEEAGKAVRWLGAVGLPGAEALSALLRQNDGVAYDRLCPMQPEAQAWAAAGGGLCPLIAGATLCDQAGRLADGGTIVLEKVDQPLLLVPYMAIAADSMETPLRLWLDDVIFTRGPKGSYLSGEADALTVARASQVTVESAEGYPGKRLRRSYRADLPEETAEALGVFAHRTYAPDTPESRLAGAGAGLSDND